MKTKPLLLGIVIGWFVYAAAGYLFPPLTFDFWRLARTSEVAFSATGIGGSPSLQFLESARIDRSATPGISYRILFAVGTPAAKCHALVGLRRHDRERFPSYVKRVQAMDDRVVEYWMDIGDSRKVSDVAQAIESYSESDLLVWQREYREWRQQKADRRSEGMPANATTSNPTPLPSVPHP